MKVPTECNQCKSASTNCLNREPHCQLDHYLSINHNCKWKMTTKKQTAQTAEEWLEETRGLPIEENPNYHLVIADNAFKALAMARVEEREKIIKVLLMYI